MYNDYYLEQINNKMLTNNNLLNEIIDNQEIIKQQNQTLISGDILIQENQKQINMSITGITISVMCILIYLFIVRSMK